MIYRSAAQAAFRDGMITPREREKLDTLARELGLTRAEVAGLDVAIRSDAIPAR